MLPKTAARAATATAFLKMAMGDDYEDIADEGRPLRDLDDLDRRGGRNDRRPKREPYVPQVAPDREQKNDAAGVSVYGKIEIKKNTEE